MARFGLAQVTRSLASCPVDGFADGDGWRDIALSLIRLGCDWPALGELAAGASSSQEVVDGLVARLAVEVGQGMGDLAVPPFWDTVCGLVARSWRLEACLAITAVYRLDGLWWTARDFDRSAARGLELIWQGMTLKELSDHVDVSRDAAELLTEADRLIPDDVRDAPFCEIVLEALR